MRISLIARALKPKYLLLLLRLPASVLLCLSLPASSTAAISPKAPFSQDAEAAAARISALLSDFGQNVLDSVPAVPKGRQAQTFEDVVVDLIDELSEKDPALFEKIRAEELRIRALPSLELRAAAVQEAYPRLERSLDKSAADGRLSPENAEKWAFFRAEAQKALAEGTLFEKAQFAGKAFDEKVQRLLDKSTSVIDPNRKLPDAKSEYMKLSKRIHDALVIPNNSTELTMRQIDQAFALAGKEFGIRPEFLKYMAKTESGLKQAVPSNPAAVGIMQIENVHKEAYSGPRNVANDTITNIVYGSLLRAQTDRTMAKRFSEAKLPLPSNPRVVEFLGDLAYNRGPGLLKYVAQYAAQQKIDVNRFAEYIGGAGGAYELIDGGLKIVVIPGPGTDIDKTGKNSALALASEAVGRVQLSKKLTERIGDRNGDGRVDHLDIWLTRGIKYLNDPNLKSSLPRAED
ncbi:MAG: transglycosylase SLT domain-containing protein [Elusimicrobiota bacterium]|jgi:soluble lytic murein transglycosylase-like protein